MSFFIEVGGFVFVSKYDDVCLFVWKDHHDEPLHQGGRTHHGLRRSCVRHLWDEPEEPRRGKTFMERHNRKQNIRSEQISILIPGSPLGIFDSVHQYCCCHDHLLPRLHQKVRFFLYRSCDLLGLQVLSSSITSITQVLPSIISINTQVLPVKSWHEQCSKLHSS